MTPRQSAMAAYTEQVSKTEVLKRRVGEAAMADVRMETGYRDADQSFYCHCVVAGVEVTLGEMWLPTLDVQKLRLVVWDRGAHRDYRVKIVYLMERKGEWVIRDLRSKTLRERLAALNVLKALGDR